MFDEPMKDRTARWGTPLRSGRRSDRDIFSELTADLDSLFGDPKRYAFLREKDGKTFFSLDLPGVRPEDVKVTVQSNVIDGTLLIVTATRRAQEGERPWRLVTEKVALPDGVKDSDVSAKMELGVLTVTVTVPKNKGFNIFKVPVSS